MISEMSVNSSTPWYDQTDSKQMAMVLCNHIENIKNRQSSSVTNKNLRHARLYGNSEIMGLKPFDYTNAITDRILSLNVVQAAIDTATARVAKMKPRPQFITYGGNYKLKKEAKKLQMYVDGVFYENKAYQLFQRAFKDAGITGTGAIKFFPTQDWDENLQKKVTKIKMERVFIDEIVVDEVGAMYTDPMDIYQVKVIHRRKLDALFPKKKAIIEKANSNMDITYLYSGLEEMVTVVEAWKLPSGGDAKDGLHVIAVDNDLLFKEEWTHDWHPFEFFRWNKKTFGFYGQGIAEQLTGIQYEINKLLKVIQTSMHLGSIPKIFLDANTKIVKQHINNEIGGIITYQGQKPSYDQMMAIPPVLFEQLDKLYARAFEIIGLSQMSVSGVKPQGLDSGKALRTFSDIEQGRFSIVSQDYDDFVLACSTKLIYLTEKAAKKDKTLSVTAFNNKFIEDIKWSEINLRRDEYLLKVFPTNFLANTPEGKMEDIKDLMSIGLLNKEQISQLMDYPDLEEATQWNNAAADDIDKVLYDIVEEGIYNPPMPQQALDYAQDLFQKVYLKLKNQKLEPERLEMLMTWIEEADLLKQRAMALAAPQMGMPGASVQVGQQPSNTGVAQIPGQQQPAGAVMPQGQPQ